jgi:hypothetical protein
MPWQQKIAAEVKFFRHGLAAAASKVKKARNAHSKTLRFLNFAIEANK